MAEIELPDYCCEHTFRDIVKGADGCDHEWQKTESADYVTWRCTKCPARCGCEVYD